jgi:hypothetical protein
MNIDFTQDQLAKRLETFAAIRKLIANAYNAYVYSGMCEVAIDLASYKLDCAKKYNSHWKTLLRLRPKKPEDIAYYLDNNWPEEVQLSDEIDEWVYFEESHVDLYVTSRTYEGHLEKIFFTDKVDNTAKKWVQSYEQLSKEYAQHPLSFVKDRTSALVRNEIYLGAGSRPRKPDYDFVGKLLSKYRDQLIDLGVNLSHLDEMHVEYTLRRIKDERRKSLDQRYGSKS